MLKIRFDLANDWAAIASPPPINHNLVYWSFSRGWDAISARFYCKLLLADFPRTHVPVIEMQYPQPLRLGEQTEPDAQSSEAKSWPWVIVDVCFLLGPYVALALIAFAMI